MKKILIAALLMGIAGCATAPAKESTAFDCAPKGYERLDGWEMRDQRTGMARATDTGQPVRITSIGMARGEERLLLVFVGPDLILVDPNPQDPDVPMLVNTRYFTADDKLRSEPQGACEWRELIYGGEKA